MSRVVDYGRHITRLSDHRYDWSGNPDHVTDPRIYVRIADEVRQMITDGTLRPGMPVPSITTLSQEHGTARMTAAKALRLLESEGLVKRVQGLGYYVV